MAYTFSFNANFAQAKKGLDDYTGRMRDAFEKTSENIQDVFTRKNKKIEESFFGSAFHTSFKQRMQNTINSLNEAQAEAGKKMEQGDLFSSKAISDKANLQASQELLAANKQVMDSILKQNMGRQRSLRMMKEQVEFAKTQLATQKAVAQSISESTYSAKIREASKNGQPTATLSAQKNGEHKKIGDSYDKLINALNSNKDQHSRAYKLAQRDLRLKKRADRRAIKRESSGGGIGGRLKSAGRGALAATGLAAITGIAGIATAFVAEGMKLDQAKSSVSGLNANISGNGGKRFGLTRAETIEKAREGMILGGRADYDFTSQLKFEKGFSMNDGALNGLAAQSRMTGNKNESASTITRQLIATMRSNELGGMKKAQGKSSYVNLGEKVDQVNQLLGIMSEQMKETNVKSATGLLALINKSGYDDKRAGRIAQSINGGITNPGDDYKQAFVLRSLKEANPEKDYIDLLEQQEKGIGDSENIDAVLKNIAKRFGDGKQGKLNASRLFGIKLSEAGNLMDTYNSGDEAGARKMVMDYNGGDNLDVEGDARGSAGYVQQQVAGVRDALAGGGEVIIKGLEKSINYMKETFSNGILPGMAKMWGDATQGLKDFFNSDTAEKWGKIIGEGARKAMLGNYSDPLANPLVSDSAKEEIKRGRDTDEALDEYWKKSSEVRSLGVHDKTAADNSIIAMADGKSGYSRDDSNAFENKLGELNSIAELNEYIQKLTEELRISNQTTKRNNLVKPSIPQNPY